jgi:hypothetical protein
VVRELNTGDSQAHRLRRGSCCWMSAVTSRAGLFS